MSVVMSDNFVGSVGQPFTGDAVYSVVAGNGTFVASHYGVGVRGAAGGQMALQQTFTATTVRVFSRIYRLSAAPGGSGSNVFQVRTASGATPSHTATINADGRLRINNSSGTVLATSTNPVPFGTEFRVVYTLNGTLFSAAIYPDISSTTATQTLSGTITSTSMDAARDGVLTSGGMPNATFDLIWPVDDNATDPGLRKYVYVTLDKTSGIVPVTVTATISKENLPAVGGTISYSIDWGDGSTSGPQAGATFTHTYDESDLSVNGGRWPVIPKVTES